MGCCCSCCKDIMGGSGESLRSEAEMTKTGKSLKIDAKMTAPTVQVEGMTVSGDGLALAGVSIEQDAAYWEWQIEEGTSVDVMFGVATGKDRQFYQDLENAEEDTPQTNGTSLMQKVMVKEEDTVGVAVQQSDLPMVQFFINGEPQHELAINRFRGTVFPSIFLPPGDDVRATLVLDENDFQQLSPHARFGPVIVARGII